MYTEKNETNNDMLTKHYILLQIDPNIVNRKFQMNTGNVFSKGFSMRMKNLTRKVNAICLKMSRDTSRIQLISYTDSLVRD